MIPYPKFSYYKLSKSINIMADENKKQEYVWPVEQIH